MEAAPRKRLVLLLSFLAAWLCLGCAEAQFGGSMAEPKMAMGPRAADAPEPPPPPGAYRELTGARMEDAVAAQDPSGGGNATPTAARPVERAPILIYTASLGLSVLVIADALRDVETMARQARGFISRRDDHSITVRVPVRSFDDVVRRIENLGDVVHRNVTVEDVTDEYTDIETRLKSAKAVRDRLRELLAKATQVQDSLAIERELSRIETDIERMETRVKYLRDQAMYSTVTVSFQTKRTETDGAKFHLPVDWLRNMGLGRLLTL